MRPFAAQDQAAGDKLNRANCNLSQAKEKLQRALNLFKHDEVMCHFKCAVV